MSGVYEIINPTTKLVEFRCWADSYEHAIEKRQQLPIGEYYDAMKEATKTDGMPMSVAYEIHASPIDAAFLETYGLVAAFDAVDKVRKGEAMDAPAEGKVPQAVDVRVVDVDTGEVDMSQPEEKRITEKTPPLDELPPAKTEGKIASIEVLHG